MRLTILLFNKIRDRRMIGMPPRRMRRPDDNKYSMVFNMLQHAEIPMPRFGDGGMQL